MKQVLTLTLSFLFIGSFAVAQETDVRKEKKRIKQEQRQVKDLNLDRNQGQQIKSINNRYKDEHKAIMQNDALSQQQQQDQIQALNKRRVQDIHNLIGQDKVKDYDRIEENERQKMKDKSKEEENRVKDKQKEKKVKEEKVKKEKKDKKNGKG
ncbi:hypothetical protein WG954_19415 [Lacibacter sp. H375]|uniref:hypothetical protein n=1 Tax=Lacibacter sp. H375 TaxID=3133424 RepID=UPI0030BFF0E0